MRTVPFPKCLFFEMDKNSMPSVDWRGCTLTPSFFTPGTWCGRVALYRLGYVDFRSPPKWLPYISTSLLINWSPAGSIQRLIYNQVTLRTMNFIINEMCVQTHLPCPVPRPTSTCTENFGRTTLQSWGKCTNCCSGKVTVETWVRCAPATSPNYCWPPPCLWYGPLRTSLDRLSVHRCTRPTLLTAKYTGV